MKELRNDVELQKKLLARVRGSDEVQVRDWLVSRSSDSRSMLFVIARVADDKPLGYLQFIEVDPVDLRADLGICLAPGNEGKGLGREALNLAIAYMKDSLKIS